VERYHYFGASAKVFHPEAVSPLGQGTDEPEQGGMLDNAAQLLTRIHARVYGADAQQQQQQEEEEDGVQQEQEGQQQEQGQEQGGNALLEQQGSVPGVRRVKRPIKRLQQAAAAGGAGGGSDGAGGVRGHNDVRECLEAERHSVLQGCSIVFSRCVCVCVCVGKYALRTCKQQSALEEQAIKQKSIPPFVCVCASKYALTRACKQSFTQRSRSKESKEQSFSETCACAWACACMYT